MAKAGNPNIDILIKTVNLLGPLAGKIVFRGSRKNLKTHLSDKLAALLKDPKFIDALPGHLPPDMASQARLPLLMERIREIAQATTKFPRTSGE